ncbi:MAG: hypothetical protein ABWZ88_20145 [Variovorax sp.]
MDALLDRSFEYRGARFCLSVSAKGPALFQPAVQYEGGIAGLERIALPEDSDPYGSAEEAWRHAQQQAVRWVHDRIGDGQGRF